MLREFPVLLSTALMMLCLGLAGCGSQTYEARLKQTEAYYDYVERLNKNLGPQFSNYGITFRAPQQFQMVPAPPKKRPAKEAKEDSENADDAFAEERDPRLPEHLNFPLPGLAGVWRATLNTTSNESGNNTGYLYLLSNYEDWQAFKTPREKGDPLKIYERIREALVAGLQVAIDDRGRGSDKVNKWYSEIVPAPKDEQFVPRKEFTAITLIPPAGDGPYSREFELYLFENGDMKMAFLYDLPKDVSMGENLQDRILLSLQTLEVSAEKPRSTGNAPAAGGGSAQPSGASF